MKHFQPHSYLCHLWCLIICDLFDSMRFTHIYDHSRSCRSSFDTLHFLIICHSNHIAIQLFQYSCFSLTIASSQHQPRETRPLFDQRNLHKKCYIALAYYEFVSYIRRNESMILFIHIFSFCRFFFPFLSISYWIWNRVNDFAYSHSIIQSILSFLLHFYIQYWNQLTFLLIHIFWFCRFLSVSVDLILNMKSSQWFCLFTF